MDYAVFQFFLEKKKWAHFSEIEIEIWSKNIFVFHFVHKIYLNRNFFFYLIETIFQVDASLINHYIILMCAKNVYFSNYFLFSFDVKNILIITNCEDAVIFTYKQIAIKCEINHDDGALCRLFFIGLTNIDLDMRFNFFFKKNFISLKFIFSKIVQISYF